MKIDSTTRIKKEFPNFKYFVVGDGPLLNKLKKESHTLNLDDVIVFTGARKDTQKILNAIDCHLFLGPKPLLGNANMEAMACGKPLIIYAPTKVDCDIAKELISEGVNGYIAKGEDELLCDVLIILKNPSKAREMGQNARKIAEERFDFSKHVRKIEELYFAVVNRKHAECNY